VGRKRRNPKTQYRYEVAVRDWSVSVNFNDYAYVNLFDCGEFEERIFMILEGAISSTSSKKISNDMPAKVILHPSDFWYSDTRMPDDKHAIGDMEIIQKRSGIEKEDTLYFRLSIPTKSYENIRAYMSYRDRAVVTLVGTDLFRRKGEIYFLGFERESL
jgi:hypothetical protein